MIHITYIILTSLVCHLTSIAESNSTISSSWSQKSYQKTNNSDKTKENNTAKPLKIYKEPNQNATILHNLSPEKGFEVQQGDWVKVTTEDGKISGWALSSEVQDNIHTSYEQEYKIVINGPSEHYKVSKISPKVLHAEQEELKKQYAEAKEIRKRNWEKLHHNLHLGDQWLQHFFAEDNIGLSEEEVHNLQVQVNQLQKEVQQLKSEKSKNLSNKNTNPTN